jgi:phosphoglycerol transferase
VTRTAEGRPERLTGGARAAVLLGCAGQGLSYIYYSFFSCLLLGAAGVLGWLRTRRVATLKLAAAGLLLILTGTAVGLAPSLLYWREHGRIPELQYKAASESDAYGLKLRHLLLPIPDHPFAPFRALARTAAEARFPLENENTTTRLGTVGSLGFLGLLAYVVGSAAGLVRREHALLGAAAALTVVALLVAQVGGFGSLFSLLVTPDIRAYNRIFVFIAFFSLLAAGLGIECLQGANIGRRPDRAVLVRGGVLVALLLAVFDQATTTALRRSYPGYARRFDLHEEFVRRVESRLPTGAMVFQLPHTGMPAEKGSAVYDHGFAYVHSRALRWSWGAWTGRNGNWQAEVQRLEPTMLVRTLALAGFSGVWIDRFRYDPEGAPSRQGQPPPARSNPEAAIARAAGDAPETSLDGRYAFISLESVRRRIISDLGPDGYERARQRALRPPMVPRFLEGFGEEEGGVSEPRRWCGATGRIVLKNTVDREREVLIKAQLRSPGPRPERVLVESSQFREDLVATEQGSSYQRIALLPARRTLQIHFSCPDRAVAGTERCFQLVDFQVVELGPAAEITPAAEDVVDEGR